MVEEGNVATFLVQYTGLALAAKTCPHRLQRFKKTKNGQAFSWEESIYISLFVYAAGSRYPKARLENVSRKSKIRLRRANIKSCLSPKVDPILKPRD